jgi:UDP-glucose:glycoprotein glucosyltransferase
LIAEACEIVAQNRGEDGFFTCLREAHDVARSSGGDPAQLLSTQKGHYEVAKRLIDRLFGGDEPRKALAGVQLSSRAFSPIVEAHRQASAVPGAARCPSGVFLLLSATGDTFCDVAEAIAATRAASTCEASGTSMEISAELPGVAHVYPATASLHRCNRIILCGAIGDAATHSMHEALATSTGIRYVFRHTGAYAWWGPSATAEQQWAAPVALQGYGVTLDVKSMEYKAVDEKAPAAAGEQQDLIETDTPRTVAGLNFEILRQRYPDLDFAFNDLECSLEIRNCSAREMPLGNRVHHLYDLGLHATYYALHSVNPLETLSRLLGAFPSVASRLSAIVFPKKKIRQLERQMLPLQMAFDSSVNAVFVNGRKLTDEPELFSIVERLQAEEDLLRSIESIFRFNPASNSYFDVINELELENAVAKMQLCQLEISSESGRKVPKRVWLDENHIWWLNDVATDPQYTHLPESYSAVLHSDMKFPTFGHPRRNIFNVVLVVDPTQDTSLSALLALNNTMSIGTAVRFGVALSDTQVDLHELKGASMFSVEETSTEKTIVPTPAAAIYVICEYLRQNDAAKGLVGMSGLEFLIRIAQRNDGARTFGSVRRFVDEELHRLVTIDDILADTAFFRSYQEHMLHLELLDLRKGLLNLLNGQPVEGELFGPDRSVLQAEYIFIREQVANRVIYDDNTPNEALYRRILEIGGARRRRRGF